MPAPERWVSDAACLNRPYEWFELPDKMEPDQWDSIRDNMRKGLRVCVDCPVAVACLLASNTDDRRETIRGGKWPTGLSKSMRGRPVGGKPPKRLFVPEVPGVPDLCRNGHDKQIVGYYDGTRCYSCMTAAWTRQYHARSPDVKAARLAVKRAAREAAMASLRASWEAMDTCGGGHLLGPLEGRSYSTKGPFCPDCRREHRNAVEKVRQHRKNRT